MNKLNTKAELRFHVYKADWLSDDVKARLSALQANKINHEGQLVVTSQEHRYYFCISFWPFSITITTFYELQCQVAFFSLFSCTFSFSLRYFFI